MGENSPFSSNTEIDSSPEINSGLTNSGDSSSLLITCHRLNGNNYLEWSQSVRIYLLGRDRLGYVTGSSKKPAATDPNYAKWIREDGQVMTWLINSMVPGIGKSFLLYPSAAEIWGAARETYSVTDNIAELYRIEEQAAALKQDSMPITLYYNTLNAYWQQLDLYESHDWADPKDAALYLKIKTQRRVFQFLQGLNNTLDDVRGRVLATSPLPSIREAFAAVKQEASRRSVMLSDESAVISEGSALLTSHSSGSNRKERPWCDYCKRHDQHSKLNAQ